MNGCQVWLTDELIAECVAFLVIMAGVDDGVDEPHERRPVTDGVRIIQLWQDHTETARMYPLSLEICHE